jgi:hypothetical protein
MTRWRCGCLALMAAGLALLLMACTLTTFAVRTRALTPPAVLLDLGPIWVGDVCRNIQSSVAPIRCAPAYTITVIVNGTRSYRLLRVPLIRRSRAAIEGLLENKLLLVQRLEIGMPRLISNLYGGRTTA